MGGGLVGVGMGVCYDKLGRPDLYQSHVVTDTNVFTDIYDNVIYLPLKLICRNNTASKCKGIYF